MSRVDFLASKYRLEPKRFEKEIWLCDPADGKPAYSTSDKTCPDKLIATVKNDNEIGIQFVPVDNNIVYYRDNGEKESSCDGMILYDNDRSICFVELKDVRTAGWLSDAISQLMKTITVFNQNHDFHKFAARTAYAANCHHPHFQNSCRDQLIDFRKKTHFRLAPEATIRIKP